MVPSRVAVSVLLLALAGLSGAPAAGAKAAVVSAVDPARDIMITDGNLLVPVDSIDIRGYSVSWTNKGFVGAEIHVSDMTRAGMEDALFAHGAHTVRMFGVTTIFEGYRAMQLFLAVVDDEQTPRAIAFFATPEGGVIVPVEAYLDREAGVLGWRLESAVEGPAQVQFATSAMYGCDDFDACNPIVGPAQAFDIAPNELVGADAIVIPGVWWDDLFPEQETAESAESVLPARTGTSWS